MEYIPKKLEKHMTKRALSAVHESLVLAGKYPDKTEGKKATAGHLLCALANEEGSISANILKANDVREAQITAGLKKKSAGEKEIKNVRELAPSYKKALKRAANYAMRQGHYFIGTEHLLYGTLTKKPAITGFGAAKIKKVKEHLDSLMTSYLTFDAMGNYKEQDFDLLMKQGKDAIFEDSDLEDVIFSDVKTKPSKSPILESFCDNLSRKAAKGELDPLVGREAELNRVVRILSRKTKNNPLLVGDAGVGKTALVAGLAQKIEKGEVPANLLNKTIYSLNLGSLVAGTLYRGEFEERIRDLIDEAEETGVILFIDEIHMLPGSGSAQGSLDAANLLKPALVNGSFQCIGATTYEEYKKTVEKDSALDRRFQKLFIKEQSPAETLETLIQLKPFYEKHHNVEVPKNILKLCVDLAVKYIPARSLPDKALDVLDEAASFARAEQMAEKDLKQLKALQSEIIDTIMEKEEALRKEHYKKAMQLKSKQEILEQKIYKLEKTNKKQAAVPKITRKTVYKTISEITGVPLGELTKKETQSLASLEKDLSKQVIGQSEAIKKVSKAITRNRTGIRQKNKPMASFLFMGPSGVGKTELAKVLAHTFSNTKPAEGAAPSSLIRLDMSEYSEAHTLARIIGAPPGYVGYEEAGVLTDKIRKNPYSVVLFDEIEKAHPRIFNVLLQILDEGTLTDSQGKTANFNNAFIILTSNVGSEHFKKDGDLGFSSAGSNDKKQSAMKKLKEMLKPEILNRLDDVIVFNSLDKSALEKIASLELYKFKKRMRGTLTIVFEESVSKWIAKKSAETEKGARGIKKSIETHIEEPLSEFMLKNKARKVTISVKNNKIAIE